ncbi:RHS repeat-associated core domain-containing protein, partial [Streptomyces sp. NPDC088812]|uniref:RHS repeat-associated core domain-containing protein n=1 Tax=Streptomyces sp. NPDC088812 TaxID=3365905 RepID=UPI0038162E44
QLQRVLPRCRHRLGSSRETHLTLCHLFPHLGGTSTTGQVSTLTDSVAGTYTAAYDADGTLTTETLPGGYTLTLTTNTTGQETAREYTDSSGTTVLSDAADYTVHGQQYGHTQTDGTTTESVYAYDDAGRLTQATDTTASSCTTRAYTFDASSNRTALTTTSDDCDTSTSDTESAAVSYSYDSADRLVNTGYAYDAFGRTTTDGNSGTTLTYYTNDLVATETLGTSRNTWDLDAAGRLAVQTTANTSDNGTTWTTDTTTTNHYAESGDSPTWTKSSDGTITRNAQDITGFAATTSGTGDVVLQLANVHGDITVQLPLDDTTAAAVQNYDEYGNALNGITATTYGALGSYQRSSNTLTGYTLMGVRLYDPTTGRFLQEDPVYYGSSNLYEYGSGDPVNNYDLSGNYLVAAAIIGLEAYALWSVVVSVLTWLGIIGATYAVLKGGVWLFKNKSKITPSQSPIWKRFKSYKGKTKTNGKSGSKRRYYEWDYTHGDIEMYGSGKKHMGSLDPITGEKYKGPVKGRTLNN